MPRILLVARSFPPVVGGIENYIYNIYSRVSSDVVAVTPFEQSCSMLDRGVDLKVYRTPRVLAFMNRRKMPIFSLFLSALKVLLSHKIEQVHCDQAQSGIIGFLFKKFFRIPYVIYAYGMEVTGGGLRRLKSIVLRNADIVFAISNSTRRALIERMQVEYSKIIIVHPGVDCVRFSPRVECNNVVSRHNLAGKKTILTVGRLASEGYKGHDMVIQALASVSSQIPDVVYLIVGSGDDMERLQRLVHDLGLQERVVFTGYVPDYELPQYYNACELFIMSSSDILEKDGKGKKGEGFGIVFLEANACGKPVIGGRSGGIEDAIVDGVTGLLVDPTSVDEISKTIIKLLTDKVLAQRLSERGRERVVNRFSWDKAAQKVRSTSRRLYNGAD